MSIGISSSSGDDTGTTTSNPQSIGQNSSLQNGSSDLQTPVNPDNINNSSDVIPLTAGSTTITTSALEETSKSSHNISGLAFIPIALIILIAVYSYLYIYRTSKKSKKYQ